MLDSVFNPLTISIGIGAVVILLVIVSIVKRYQVAGSDEALIITGKGARVVKNNTGVFVIPFVQRVSKLYLGSRQLTIETEVQTVNGITIQVTAVAQIKIDGGSEEAIRNSAERFGSQQSNIDVFTQEALRGALRTSVGSVTVEQMITDREGMSKQVRDSAEEILTPQGLKLDSFQIQTISDENGYIEDIGRPKAAENRRLAREAEAEAERSAQEAQLNADKAVLLKRRELDIQAATIQEETDKARSIASAAAPLEEAIQQQRIISEQSITAQRTAELREQQLNSTVRKEADAEAYRVTTLAQAEAEAQRRNAEAARDARIAESVAAEAEGRASATITREIGSAEAEAIQARGLAEAASARAQSEAIAEQSAAFLTQEALRMLPLIAKEIAAPMSNIDNLTIVGTQGAGEVSKQVVNGITETTSLLEGATGIDLKAIFNNVVGGTAAGAAAGSAAARANKASTSGTEDSTTV